MRKLVRNAYGESIYCRSKKDSNRKIRRSAGNAVSFTTRRLCDTWRIGSRFSRPIRCRFGLDGQCHTSRCRAKPRQSGISGGRSIRTDACRHSKCRMRFGIVCHQFCGQRDSGRTGQSGRCRRYGKHVPSTVRAQGFTSGASAWRYGDERHIAIRRFD